MGSASATFVGQAQGYKSLGNYGTAAVFAGYNGSSYYAASIKFTAPEFSGVSSKIELKMVNGNGYGSSATLNYAICTSDVNITSYMTYGTVSDTHQIATGTITVSGGSGSYDTTNIIALDANGLTSGATFFIILWAGAEKNGMGMEGRKTSLDTPSATVFYNSGMVYIADGSTYAAYQVYIANGTEYELYLPYIADGSEYVLYTG